jgi:hypothetical protein
MKQAGRRLKRFTGSLTSPHSKQEREDVPESTMHAPAVELAKDAADGGRRWATLDGDGVPRRWRRVS